MCIRGAHAVGKAEGNIVGGIIEATSDPAWSKNQGMYGTFMCENREIPRPPIRVISGRDAQGTPRR